MDEPASYASTIRLMLRMTKDGLRLLDGSALPRLHEGAFVEAIIGDAAIVDDAERERLTREQRLEFLPAQASLWARVRIEDIPGSLALYREAKASTFSGSYRFVKIVLKESLHVTVSAGNLPVLTDCECQIPALPHIVCHSVNEAYTRISEAFEPTRRSHTGNVFQCVGYEQDGQVRPLQALRVRFQTTPSDELGLL